jgi:hypothetical protein
LTVIDRSLRRQVGVLVDSIGVLGAGTTQCSGERRVRSSAVPRIMDLAGDQWQSR